MKLKTSKLEGIALDWTVTFCESSRVGATLKLPRFLNSYYEYDNFRYSTEYNLGGPLADQEGIATGLVPQPAGYVREWYAYGYRDPENCRETKRSHGPTRIIAAMRCFVESKLGEYVEVPDELFQLGRTCIKYDEWADVMSSELHIHDPNVSKEWSKELDSCLYGYMTSPSICHEGNTYFAKSVSFCFDINIVKNELMKISERANIVLYSMNSFFSVNPNTYEKQKNVIIRFAQIPK